jgi:hypothetical protein
MTRRLFTAEITLTNAPLRAEQEHALLRSPNAMSAFVYPDSYALPPSTYLPAYRYTHFIGAVHLEENPVNNIVTIHPMLLKRDRTVFNEVTEAAILWCLNNHLVPTAQVLNDEAYRYMHDFLMAKGFVAREEKEWVVYTLPPNWRPTSFSIYTMEFA